MTLKEEALAKHYEWKGKIEVISRTPIKNREQLSLAYTPGVAEPCLEIAKDPMKMCIRDRYTCSDGHISRCWLMDKRAKEVTPPDGVPTLPRGGKEHE